MHDHRHRLALLLAAALLAGVAAWAGPALADEAGASPTPAVATLADGTTESTATATATATDGATDTPTPGDGATGGATSGATATATASDEATATETVTPTDTPTTEVPSPTVTPTPISDPDPGFRPRAGQLQQPVRRRRLRPARLGEPAQRPDPERARPGRRSASW